MSALYKQPLAIVDVETTGGSPIGNRVIDIGIIRIEEGKIIEKFQSVIDPEQHIPDFIKGLTGIGENDINHAPTFSDIAHDIHGLLKDAVFVAHNARFDYGFIKNELKRAGISYNAKCLCTVKLSRALFPRYKRHNLSTLMERFNLECEDRHRALPDAEVVADFLSHCVKKVDQEKLDRIVVSLLQTQSLPTLVPQEKIDALPQKPGVYIFYGADGDMLYIGKSRNIRQRVLSHFSGDHTSTKEMRLTQEVADIEWIETTGDLSALLLESYMIKREQPLFNRMSRRTKKLVVAREEADATGYKTLALETLNHIEEADSNVIGIYRSLSQAKKSLQELCDEHTLCPKLLSLEKGKMCFYSQLGKCKGACGAKESTLEYNIRFDTAFASRRLRTWPYSGAIVLDEKKEGSDTEGTVFIIDNWRLVKSFKYDESGEQEFLPQESVFDHDSYKILSRHILHAKRNAIKPYEHESQDLEYVNSI